MSNQQEPEAERQPGSDPEPPGPPSARPSAASPVHHYRAVAFALTAALLLVFAVVAAAPIWAPLLPGGEGAAEDAAVAARLDRLEAAQAKTEQQLQRQVQDTAAEAKAALQRLEQRVGAVEKRPAAASGDLGDVRDEMAKLSRAVAELAGRGQAIDAIEKSAQVQSSRLESLEKTVQAQSARLEAVDKSVTAQSARGTSDAGLAIALLQIRTAVEAGRPFAAEYEALTTLARGRAAFEAAAAPLAEPAKTGVASRSALAKRLHELAGTIAAADGRETAASDRPSSWGDEALARLRGLVTIRRIDGARPGGAEAAVNAAEQALAGGDLAGAVSALDKLTGAPAEAAAPWLRMAQQRLAVEAALRAIEAQLAAGLGNPALAPGSSG